MSMGARLQSGITPAVILLTGQEMNTTSGRVPCEGDVVDDITKSPPPDLEADDGVAR